MDWLVALEKTAARLPLTIAYRRDRILGTRGARYDNVITELALLRSIREANRADRYSTWVRQGEVPWDRPAPAFPINDILPSFPLGATDFDPVEQALVMAATNYALVDVWAGIQNMYEMTGTVPQNVADALNSDSGTGVLGTPFYFSDVYDWVDGVGHNIVSGANGDAGPSSSPDSSASRRE